MQVHAMHATKLNLALWAQVSCLCGVGPACGVKVGVQCDPGRGASNMKSLKKEVSWHIQGPERKPTQLKHRAQRGEWAQVRMVHVLACSHRELEAKGRLQLCLLSTKTLISTVFSPWFFYSLSNCSDFQKHSSSTLAHCSHGAFHLLCLPLYLHNSKILLAH